MKFFLDTNMPYSVLQVFTERRYEALHARDAGLAYASDAEIFDFAVKSNMILVTKDLEFGNKRIFSLTSSRGIIIVRLPFFFHATQVSTVLKNFLQSVSPEHIQNALTIIKLGTYRIRPLT